MRYLIFFFLVPFLLLAQNAITTDPENGSLVVVGRGRVGKEITQTFIELAGGKDANMVHIDVITVLKP